MTSQEAFRDLGCSSSDESSHRRDSAEAAPAETKTPVVHRHHPFSVEAIMSGRKLDRGASVRCKPEAAGLSSVFLCSETYSPTKTRNNLVAAPSSPVKSETSESDDWITNSAFSSQPRKLTPACTSVRIRLMSVCL